MKSKQRAHTSTIRDTLFGSQHPPLVFGTLLLNEIRVARCKFVGESTFTIVLQKVNLDNGPAFDALSYAWGDREEGALIRAADHPTGVEITPNLLSAMKHIWSFSPDRAIWIDALYINQQNLTERTQQVSLMTRIYRQAKQVLVWLRRR